MMKNPEWFCQTCKKMHSNPVIHQFNSMLAHVCEKAPPEAAELDMFRAYTAGSLNTLRIMSMIVDAAPEDLAVRLVNQLAINVRDAVVAGLEDCDLKDAVRRSITESLAIRESGCHGN